MDIQNIQDNPAQHLTEEQKRKLTFGIAILGDPKVSTTVHGEECRWTVNEKPSSSFTSERSSAFLVMYKRESAVTVNMSILDIHSWIGLCLFVLVTLAIIRK